MTTYRTSKRVAAAYEGIAAHYFADEDGHWLTLRKGYSVEEGNPGARIVHEWTAKDMIDARRLVVKDEG